MSWFWGGGRKDSKDDPAKSLDQDLKKFLDEQQPKPYSPAELPTPPETKKSITPVTPDVSHEPVERSLPKESLFQDGRYKEIWKTYVPQAEMDAATSTPVDRVLNARKDRRQTIHKAALENCAFEQQMQQDCMTGGTWAQKIKGKMTLCHEENKAYNRCYSLQAKFLQALGYMANPHNTDEDEEKIQMHADKLYHRMMDYEADVDEAKRNDRPIPPLSSLFDPNRAAPTLSQLVLPPAMAGKMKKPLDEYAPHERELAAKAAIEEAKVSDAYARDLFTHTVTMNKERQERQEWLTKAFGDTIGKFLIPDAPSREPSADATALSYDLEELERKIWQGPGQNSK